MLARIARKRGGPWIPSLHGVSAWDRPPVSSSERHKVDPGGPLHVVRGSTPFSGICRATHRQGAVAPETAIEAFDHFLEKSGAKYNQACEILKKDRDVLLTFYDFPAEHWRHLRTTNPIESTFATIRLHHRRADFSGTGDNGAWQASLDMMFKPAQSAAKHWHKLNSPELILSLVEGNAFTDAVPQRTHAA